MSDLFFAYKDSKDEKRCRWFYGDDKEWKAKPDSAGWWEKRTEAPDGYCDIATVQVRHGKRGLEMFYLDEWHNIEDFASVYPSRFCKVK